MIVRIYERDLSVTTNNSKSQAKALAMLDSYHHTLDQRTSLFIGRPSTLRFWRNEDVPGPLTGFKIPVLNSVIFRESYRGDLQEEIALSAARCEPRRSEELRKIRVSVLSSLRIDLARCCVLVRALRPSRRSGEAAERSDLHTAVSLKHNHLCNDLANLDWIDKLLSMQLDLFDC